MAAAQKTEEILKENFKAESVVKTVTSTEAGDSESFVTTFRPVDDEVSIVENVKIKTYAEKFEFGQIVSISIVKVQKKLSEFKKKEKEED